MIFCLGTKGLHFSISALQYAVFLTDIVYFKKKKGYRNINNRYPSLPN